MFALDHFVAFGIADTTRLEQDRAKWYLELLRAGLYEAFFAEIKKGIQGCICQVRKLIKKSRNKL